MTNDGDLGLGHGVSLGEKVADTSPSGVIVARIRVPGGAGAIGVGRNQPRDGRVEDVHLPRRQVLERLAGAGWLERERFSGALVCLRRRFKQIARLKPSRSGYSRTNNRGPLQKIAP